LTYPKLARRGALAVLAAFALPASAPAAEPSTGGAAYGAAEPAEESVKDLGPGERLLAGSSDRVTFSYAGASGGTVEAVRADDGTVVRRWPIDATATDPTIRWDGTVGGQPVPTGRYAFRIADAATSAQVGGDTFAVVDATFPIDGRYEFGTAFTNGFGGGRGHQGHDVFAACGTPLVAVRPARVQVATSQPSRAGNYVVLQDAKGASYAYMHMRDSALVSKGDRVRAGQVVGYVGDTGRAYGCHLHFERWTAPGWYEGGEAVDPLAELRRWEAFRREQAPTERSAASRSKP